MGQAASLELLPRNRLHGIVMGAEADFYRVRLVESELTLLCVCRARLQKTAQQVLVGDRVIVEPDWSGQRGAIEEILPRFSHLSRPAIANIDQVLVVFALAEPQLDEYLLSRFLVKAETTGLAVNLCLTKADLVSETDQRRWQERLRTWGYQPICISLVAQSGLEQIRAVLGDRTSVLAGPSGVGKSRLTNSLIPGLDLSVAAVSGKLQKGRHTTRHVQLYHLPSGGLLADTPGFNQAEIDCLPQELIRYFPESHHIQQPCQYHNCSHRHEPNCAVRGDWERYNHYLNFLQELEASRDRYRPETGLKIKHKGGKVVHEPRLAAKKYRRTSRRNQHQILQGSLQEEEY